MTGTYKRYRYFDPRPVSFRVRYPTGGIDTLLFGSAERAVPA